jgi:hypothetical protein
MSTSDIAGNLHRPVDVVLWSRIEGPGSDRPVDITIGRHVGAEPGALALDDLRAAERQRPPRATRQPARLRTGRPAADPLAAP